MPALPSAPAPWRGRILVLLGILLVALNLRIAVASVSPILDVVRRDVALTAAEAGLLGTVPVVSFALFGSLAPLVARRIGLEPSLVVAMLLSATGEVVRSTTETSAGFLGWSVIALAGMGMGNVLLPPTVKRYFPDRIGPVTALYSVSMSISTATPPLLAVPLAASLGWRVSLGSWAVVALLATVPWVVVVLRSVRARGALRQILLRAPQDTPALTSRHRGAGRVWRSPLAWALAVTFGMNSLNTYVLLAWLPQMLVDVGLGSEVGGLWLALFAILGLPASLVAPMLAVRVRNPFVVVAVFASCFVVGYLGLWLAPLAALPVWMVLLGLGPGTFPLLLALINLRTRTSAGASSLSGFAQGVGYALSAAGPVLAGVLYEATGGWAATFAMLLATVGVLVVAGAVTCRPVMLEDTWLPRTRG
ncbi:MFS transporter [Actinotalea sp. C106]|uniref:CynX/NimT family MFS transporter n=1 Tax=Actinotalea sp. C106 TaxID=2908644 RepID=UPI0020282121|nr:MFS transporter [Actinotalea sp. C106]